MSGERIVAALIIGVLVVLLIVTTSSARHAAAMQTLCERQMAVDESIISGLRTQLADARAALTKPEEETRPPAPVPVPDLPDVGHDTPIFSCRLVC